MEPSSFTKVGWRDILHLHPDCQELFIPTLELEPLRQAGITLAGRSQLTTSYRVGRADPDCHTIVVTLAGAGILHCEQGSMAAEADSMLVLPAGQPFLFELPQGEQWQTCWFVLADNERWRFLRQRQASVEALSGQNFQLDQTLATLAAELQQSPSAEEPLDLLSQLLLSFLDRVLQRQQALPKQQVKLTRLFDEVARQLHFPWTVAELANRMFVSEPQLYRLARQYLGMSPMHYITQLRVQRGKNLLLHSQLSVKQIAQSLGYEDGLSFSHCFKKHVGVAPQHWRQQRVANVD